MRLDFRQTRFMRRLMVASALAVLAVGSSPAFAKIECPLKIGSVRPESGGGASFGQSLARGLTMGIEEVNAAGGIDGCPIELIAYDTQSLPANAATLTNRLISQDDVKLILGSSISTETLAMMEVTENRGFPLYVPSAASAKITNQGAKWVWRQSVIDAKAAELFVQYIIDTFGYKKIGAVYENTDYGHDPVMGIIAPALKKHGIEVSTEAFNTGDSDVSSQLLSLKGAGAEAIIFWGHEKEGALVTRQNIQLGMNLPILGNTGLVYPAYLDLLTDDEQANTNLQAVSQFVWTTDVPAQVAWIDRYRAKYNLSPDVTSMDGYDSIFLLKQAYEAAGSTDPESLKKALGEIRFKGVGGTISFDETGQALRSLIVVKLTPKSEGGFKIVKILEPGK